MVVVACVRIVEDLAQGLQVGGAQEVGDVAHRLRRETGERLGFDPQELACRAVERRDTVGGDEPVRRVRGTQREEVGIGELTHEAHGTPRPGVRRNDV